MRTPTPRLATTAGRSRKLPIAIGVLVLAAIAGGVAWMQGWVGGPRPAETSVAAIDPAKAKLEADLAASEKARLQAEQRATTADAGAIRARAEAEAAALRAKAEADAVAMKAKAQSEAATLRAQAAQDAGRAKAADADAIKARAETEAAALKAKSESEAAAVRAKAQTEVAAMQANAAQEAKAAQEAATAKAAQEASATKAPAATVAPVASDNANRYDGMWLMTFECAAYRTLPPTARNADFIVRGGEFVMERGTVGQPGYNIVRGRPSPDGTLVLTGNAVGNQAFNYGKPFEVYFAGRWATDRYVLHGSWGGRKCDVEVVRK